jgi:NAD(P)-dependent dehydrogenase (short-subunit alcohol dehydrogenase family)
MSAVVWVPWLSCPTSTVHGLLTVLSYVLSASLHNYAAYAKQAYNTSKSALNSMTVHYAYLLWQKQPNSRVIALNPGYNATEMNRGHDDGAQDPALGAAGIVRMIAASAESEFKTAEFRDWTGKAEEW